MGNDVELSCTSGKEHGTKEREMYRIHKIDWAIFEGVVYLLLRWKRVRVYDTWTLLPCWSYQKVFGVCFLEALAR